MTRSFSRFTTLTLLALTSLPLAHAGERQTYACDNGSRLELSFSEDADGRPQATLHFADGDIVLPAVPAASGARYRRDPITLHTKGSEAMIEDEKGNLRRCQPAASAQPAAASSFLEVGGSVRYLARIALPPDAILAVRIQDTARADAPARTLVEQRYELNGAQPPIPFSATVDRDLLGKKGKLTASARITHRGRLLFISDRSYPLLQDGQPVAVDMVLRPASPQR